MGEAAKVLRRLLDPSGACVFDYADFRDFDALWASLDDGCVDLASKLVVICWSGTAADPSVAPIATGPHITPLDWAACAAAKRIDVQVTVVDLDPRKHLKSPAAALYSQLDRSSFPWLRIIQPADLAVRSRDELQVLFSSCDRSTMDSSPSDFLALRRAVLTAPHPSSDRHAITNLIGPMVLLSRRHEDVAGHSKALWHLLEAAGLIPPGNEKPSAGAAKDLDGLRELAPVRVVLLDDQWHHGWAEWVGRCLGLPWDNGGADRIRAAASGDPGCLLGSPDSGVSLWVSGTPDWLLDRLTKALETSNADPSTTVPKDARFRLRLTGESAGTSEILLLDLRLFPPDGAAAKAFISSAMPLVKRFLATDTPQSPSLPWPGFIPSEVSRLERWAAWAGLLRAVVYSRRHGTGPSSSCEVACGVGPVSRGDANLWRETIEVGGHLFVPIGETGDSRIDVSVGEVIEFQVSGVVVERRAGKQSLGWANARALKKTTEPPTPLSDVLRYGDANDPSAALTVLPRLTALADMSLPIVLFSSTGRRDIVAKLDGYESVVTRFSKPRFFGDASNVAEETDRAFAEALTEAAVLLRGRRSISSATGVPTTTHVRRTVGTGYRHASLYLDESGDAGQVPFTVGGILALFPDSSMEQTFDKKLKDCKIHWGPGGLGKYKDTSPESLEVYGTKIINEASDSGVALRAIALTVLDPEGAVATRIGRTSTTARSLDRLHRTLFRTAIEIALFHVIVDEEIDKNWTFGVCTDVRNRPARLFAEAQLRELRDQFGLYPEVFAPNQRGWKAAGTLLTLFSGSREDRLSLYTVLADFLKRGFPLPAAPNSQLIRFHEAVDGLLEGTATAKAVSDLLDELLRKESRIGFIGSDEVLPLVEDLLNGYEGAERLQHVRITEARACHLPEGNKSALSATNRSLNFFADWLAGAVRDSHKNAGIALPQWAMDLLDDGGCNDIYDTGLEQSLQLARWTLRGEIIRAASGLIAAQQPRVQSPLRQRCAATVAGAVLESTGSTFVDACGEVVAAQRVMVEGSGAGGPATVKRPGELFLDLGGAANVDKKTIQRWLPLRATKISIIQPDGKQPFAIVKFDSEDGAAKALQHLRARGRRARKWRK